MTELLSLRWNNHMNNFKFALGLLQQKELFSDATVSCEEQFFPVHKFVLSMCSDYFANVFERTPCKHPVIVLRDVSSRDFEFLLSYMYSGEVSVSQVDLPSLIRNAEALQIKGLAAPDDSPLSPHSTSKQSRSCDNLTEKSSNENPKKKSRLGDNANSSPRSNSSRLKQEMDDDKLSEVGDDTSSINDNHNYPSIKTKDDELATNLTDSQRNLLYDEDIYIKKENVDTDDVIPILNDELNELEPLFESSQPFESSEDGTLCQNFTSDCSSNVDGTTLHSSNLYRTAAIEQVQRDIFDSTDNDDEMVSSKSKVSASTTTAYNENLANIISKTYKCSICDYTTINKCWLRIHMRRHTGEKPFQCPHCPYKCAQRGNLNVHIKNMHLKATSSNAFQSSSSPYVLQPSNFLFEPSTSYILQFKQ